MAQWREHQTWHNGGNTKHGTMEGTWHNGGNTKHGTMEGTPNMAQWREHQTWHNGGNTKHGLPDDNCHKHHHPNHHRHYYPHCHHQCIGRGGARNSMICLCGCVHVCGHCTCVGDAHMYKYVDVQVIKINNIHVPVEFVVTLIEALLLLSSPDTPLSASTVIM